MIGENLSQLRKMHKLSQEELAHKIGVSRQAVSKWETNESTPDLDSCIALADYFNVSLDDLVNYSASDNLLPVPPKGKYIFGIVTVGDKGQIVIPKKARDVFNLKNGDNLILLGDEMQGLAMIKEKNMIDLINNARGI